MGILAKKQKSLTCIYLSNSVGRFSHDGPSVYMPQLISGPIPWFILLSKANPMCTLWGKVVYGIQSTRVCVCANKITHKGIITLAIDPFSTITNYMQLGLKVGVN